MQKSNEQLITELVGFVSEMVPVNVENMRGKLSGLLSTYAVEKVQDDETHPDLTDNIKLYLANKKLEGMALNSLNSYGYELRIFSNFIKKRTEDITAGVPLGFTLYFGIWKNHFATGDKAFNRAREKERKQRLENKKKGVCYQAPFIMRISGLWRFKRRHRSLRWMDF